MATICKRLKDPLAYLEQVRQHLGRLPSIDPNTRTLLICGYPNVGKSSFLRSISRADVDVQPYAFTTKSLFVGHFDYKMLRFQAIDTPGILDHPLEEMNTIEMQSITAIAHLRSAILYFMDLSEQCGYSVSHQIQLFQSIKPLFANKLAFIIINKIDLCQISDLDPETQKQLNDLVSSGEVELLTLSCTTTENVMSVRNAVCERLIAARNAQKLAHSTNSAGEPTGRLSDLLRRIHVAQPLGGVVREAFIPEAVQNRAKYDKSDPARRKLERDFEAENGGAGVYSVDMKKHYLEIDPSQIHDIVPEILNGRNVADYMDADIAQKLADLEAEEEKLDAEGFYASDEEPETLEEAETHYKADLIREKRQLIRNEAQQRKSLNNRAVMPRSKGQGRPLSQMTKHLSSLGHDTAALSARERTKAQAAQARAETHSVSRGRSVDAMEIDGADPRAALVGRKASRSAARSVNGRAQSTNRAHREPSTNRRSDGVTDPKATVKAERMMKLGQRKMNRMARQGEADRHVPATMPKHLVCLFLLLSIAAAYGHTLVTVLTKILAVFW